MAATATNIKNLFMFVSPYGPLGVSGNIKSQRLRRFCRAALQRQNSYAAGAQEFATQPYPLADDVQTQRFAFCIIRGDGDSRCADYAERAADWQIAAADFASSSRLALRATPAAQIRQPTYTFRHSSLGLFERGVLWANDATALHWSNWLWA
jgi:hypothetical protein